MSGESTLILRRSGSTVCVWFNLLELNRVNTVELGAYGLRCAGIGRCKDRTPRESDTERAVYIPDGQLNSRQIGE